MPRFRRSAIAAWALAAGALALLFARAWRIDYPYSIDFQTYWLAGARVIDGRAADLYAAGGGPADGTPAAMGAGEFKNLPIVAAAFAPFGLLDYATAKRTFWWLSLLSLAGTAWLLGRFVLPVEIGSTASRCALAFAPLAAMAPAHIALRHGQTTPLVALALAGSLAATVRRRPAPAGVALAVACLVKFPPLAIVPLDLARRRLRAAAACAAAIAAVVVASIAAFGPPLHHAYLAGIAEQAGRVMPAHNNQSLAATATRLSHRVEPSAWTPRPLPRDAAIATAIGAAALLAAVAAGVAGKGRRVEAEHAAVLAAGILLLPVAWDHYFLMLAPAAIALAGVLWARGALARPGILAAAAAGAALLGLPTPARLLEGGPSPLPVAIVLSHYFAGALVLLGLAVASLRTADA
ncbi:MAG TPA: glycosyltransferase family 87 protein [Candidatus Polarisedimenticolaceae bacterium]|nr:glycosyltransferase family 87 protein [Candidatus Polarisedimenticolaceae bacterium]